MIADTMRCVTTQNVRVLVLSTTTATEAAGVSISRTKRKREKTHDAIAINWKRLMNDIKEFNISRNKKKKKKRTGVGTVYMENGSRKGIKETISKTLKGKMRAIEQQSAAIFPFDKISIGFVSIDDVRLMEKYRAVEC